MIYSLNLGIAYYPVPKCACTSIRHALFKWHGIEPGTQQELHTLFPGWSGAYPHILELPQGKLRHEAPEGLLSFAVVRNPYTRLASAYQNKVVDGNRGVEECYRKGSFREFVHEIVKRPPSQVNVHMRPQHKLLPKRLGCVLRFESLAEDWQKLCGRMGEDISLPRRNQSRISTLANYYDEDIVKLVSVYYRQDFLNYGYATDFAQGDVDTIAPLDNQQFQPWQESNFSQR